MANNATNHEVEKPHPAFGLLRRKIKYFLDLNVRRRVPFSYEDVASSWGVGGVGLPHFSARLHNEVKQLNETIGDYHATRSLEIGCGYGRLSPWIADHSDEHYAVEPEPDLLRDARLLYPSVKFYQARAQKLPFVNRYFDLCVTWTVLQHIPPIQLPRAIQEMKRVCTKRAIIVLAEENARADGRTSWFHTVVEWRRMLSPWKLVSQKERKIEETYEGTCGLVMRFER